MGLLLFLGIIAFQVFVLSAWFLSAVLEYFYGTYVESLPLSFLFGGAPWVSSLAMDVLILSIAQYMSPIFLSRRVCGWIFRFVFWRAMEVFFTKKGVLALGILDSIAVGIIPSILISHGMVKQRGGEEQWTLESKPCLH